MVEKFQELVVKQSSTDRKKDGWLDRYIYLLSIYPSFSTSTTTTQPGVVVVVGVLKLSFTDTSGKIRQADDCAAGSTAKCMILPALELFLLSYLSVRRRREGEMEGDGRLIQKQLLRLRLRQAEFKKYKAVRQSQCIVNDSNL